MGREVKRVPADFDWPLSKVWKGFINPFYKYSFKCEECEGSGYSPEGKRLQDEWYGYVEFDATSIGAKPLSIDCPHLRLSVERKIEHSQRLAADRGEKDYYTQDGYYTMQEAVDREIKRMYGLWKNQWAHQLCQADVDALVEDGRLYDFTHRPIGDFNLEDAVRTRAYFLWEEAGYPQGDGAEFWAAAWEEYTSRYWLPFPNGYHPTAEEVNAWSMHGMGHGSNFWICMKARAKREGIDPLCPTCKGECNYWEPAEMEKKAEEWEEEQPPEGEAFQIWETVSEGSPVSPPFVNPEELAQWMVENDDSVTKDTDFEGWMKFILGDGWAPSGMMSSKGWQSGVKAITDLD